MKRYIKTATKTFPCRFSSDTITVDRTTKQLTVSNIIAGDYYNGTDHNIIRFKDTDGIIWYYSCPTTFREMQTAIGRLSKEHENDGTIFTISAYFVRERDDVPGNMFNPRLVK